ncbi:UNVERIFIED_CONTAM: hypothetical protein GTU68_007177 [Idotea baltica]|nr:hypothetical protein [Idotea baltica]
MWGITLLFVATGMSNLAGHCHKPARM